MSDTQDVDVIRITDEDIAEANNLSLHCPICASAVERYAANADLAPVFCRACETLYHSACWHQNGNKCAVLGCNSSTYRRYRAVDLGPVLRISRLEIAREERRSPVSPNRRTKRLKEDERRLHQEVAHRNLWRDIWQSLLRAIKLWPSDPS